MAGISVIFDFDRTIIDGDSDRWVVTEMGITNLFQQLLRTMMPWNSLMNRMMEEIHLQGNTADDVAECLKRTPLPSQIIAAIKSADAFGCDLRIVSDSNSFFIDTILKHHGILECFSKIYTNPALIDEEGRLRISPYHEFNSSAQLCDLCPSNMCKGAIIAQIRSSLTRNGQRIFIYIGDGKNDYCPSIKFGERDHVMPRKDFPLMELIRNNPNVIKAEVHEWSNGEELRKILLHLINTFSVEENIGSKQL